VVVKSEREDGHIRGTKCFLLEKCLISLLSLLEKSRIDPKEMKRNVNVVLRLKVEAGDMAINAE